MENYPRFTGKKAIVTGGGFGIGRAVCMRLASDEASYIIGATLTIDGGFAAGTPLGSGVLPIPDGTVELTWLEEFDYVKEYLEWKREKR